MLHGQKNQFGHCVSCDRTVACCTLCSQLVLVDGGNAQPLRMYCLVKMSFDHLCAMRSLA